MEPRTISAAPATAYVEVRDHTLECVASLSEEDMVVQSMPEASPAKWHLAHTTWFFETFILEPLARGYRSPDRSYAFLFNSYYQTVGPQYPRNRRGLLTRPPLAQVHRYRQHVDAAMEQMLARCASDGALAARVELGLAHEQQHQELLLTDVKHLFSCNPLAPAFRPVSIQSLPVRARALEWIEGPHGIVEIGSDGAGFSFDNEGPRHKVHLAPYALADRLVTNAEVREFIDAGGYRRGDLWLSDGWAQVQREDWQRPLYWHEDLAHTFTLTGTRTLEDHAPATHLSFYEADAYARWAKCRLPTEAEWEAVARTTLVRHAGELHPRAQEHEGFREAYGACWQWTASAYGPYPGFRAAAGSLGEYNGKFMANQMVLRGSSCVTPRGHARATYRNFFYPHSRWQFTGVRLAKDLS